MTMTTLGWLVVHSFWQGTLVVGVAALILGLMRRAAPQARYRVAAVALVVAAVAPAITAFTHISGQHWRLPEPALRAVEQRLDMTSVIWWASVLVPIAGGLWLAGVAVGALRLALAARQVRRLRRSPISGSRALETIAARLSRRFAIQPVTVRCSPLAEVPMVVGWREPVILLPEGTTQQLTPRQLRALLAHEVEHVRRGDIAANIVQLAIDVLMFHHPAVRWLSRGIRTEREYCCDDAAVSVARHPADYIRALATLEDARGVTPFAVAAGSGTLLDRVRRMAGQPRPLVTPLRGAVMCLLALCFSAGWYGATLFVPRGLPWRAEVRARRPGPPPQPDASGARPRLPRSLAKQPGL